MRQSSNHNTISATARLERAQSHFEAAAKDFSEAGRRARSGNESDREELLKRNDVLSAAERELLAAKAAFDQSAPRADMVAATPTVLRVVESDFPNQNRSEVIDLLEKKIGTNLPFRKNDSAEELERVRLAVLKLAHGKIDELRRQIDIANVDWRDVINAAEYPEASGMPIMAYTKLNKHQRQEIQERDQDQYERWLVRAQSRG